MTTPAVPPRPARVQPSPTATQQETPHIPPRPIRKTDPSPDREYYTRSPLNALPGFRPPPQPTSNDGPRRPPSISLPSDAGQEGSEYSSYDQLPEEAHGLSSSTETRNVAADVPLHAPKASIPASTAKRNIAMVTRTDSSNSSPAGAGRSRTEEELAKYQPETHSPLVRMSSRDEGTAHRRPPSVEGHPLRNRTSFNRSHQSLPGTSRPPSMHGDYDGIPEIGKQIPLYPNAGDVQAPSPGNVQSQHAPGIGFFNDGSARAHHRKRSSRHEFGPPDSYGLHGHGMMPQDQFERDWIAKHPNEAAKEGFASHVYRPESALSSEQLNRLVNINQDVGMGTNRDMVSTPTQEIAFDATDKYTQKISTKPSPLALGAQKRPSSGNLAPVESALRNATFGSDNAPKGAAVLDDEDNIIHVDETSRPVGKVQPEQPEHIERSRTPILADDEVIKRPGSAYMHPAVSADSHYDDYYDSDHYHANNSRRSSLQPPSRPSSRPGSVHGQQQGTIGGYHGGPLHRYVSHEEHHSPGVSTPLAEIEEYEPLFPENDQGRPKIALKKRPSLTHHFPSQDIWEDTPSSLQYQAEVDTPEPEHERNADADGKPAQIFETPEQEQKRKSLNPADMTSDQKTFAKPHFKGAVRDELGRPHPSRFPSQDIWEDTPDSMRLVTTVHSSQEDDVLSPPEDRPTTAALPLRQDDPNARSTTTGLSHDTQPRVPERPQRRSKLAQDITHDVSAPELGSEVPDLGSKDASGTADKARAPSIPDRPKPSVPARPGHLSQQQADGAPLTSVTSNESDGQVENANSGPSAPKAKPAVPARPMGGKLAALKAGFMNDLNNRLQLGPQGAAPKPKEAPAEEVVEEREPLQDARKSRARGPPRRKPASGADSNEISVSATAEKNLVPTTEAETKTSLPIAAVGSEGDLPDPSTSDSTLERQDAIKDTLHASLAQGGQQTIQHPEVVEAVPVKTDEPAAEVARTVEAAETDHVV